MVIRVCVGSKNPIKVRATSLVFQESFSNVEIYSYDVSEFDSQEEVLKSQPIGEEETFNASQWRVKVLRQRFSEYDFYVGIEGGIAETIRGQARIILYSTVANNRNIVTIRGCEIPLPSGWFEELRKNKGLELGDVASEASGVENIKQKQGAVGYFTNNRVTRLDILKESLMMCLVPFQNEKLFWNEYKD
ncbi:MAG: DUF84 family protein [Candidatus Hodarchaeales archaeon]